MRDVARVEEEKHIEQSENSTQRNTVYLCPSATQGKRQCWLACWLPSFFLQAFSFLLPAMQCSTRLSTLREPGA